MVSALTARLFHSSVMANGLSNKFIANSKKATKWSLFCLGFIVLKRHLISFVREMFGKLNMLFHLAILPIFATKMQH